jgi:hypothetical protein
VDLLATDDMTPPLNGLEDERITTEAALSSENTVFPTEITVESPRNIESPQTPPPDRPHLEHHFSLNGRTDMLSNFLREEYTKITELTDEEVYKASIGAGIIKTVSEVGRKFSLHEFGRVEHEKLRDELADFNAFTQFMERGGQKILQLGDGIVEGDMELWIGEDNVNIKRKRTTGLASADDGAYKWVYWKDGSGVVRTAIRKEGSAVVKTFRAMRWPKRRQRWRVFSFHERDAHTPWERNPYVNRLQKLSSVARPNEPPNLYLEKEGARISQSSVPPPLNTKVVQRKIFWGAEENFVCSLLRVETIDALALYCTGDYYGFMDMVHTHKSLITQDLIHNLNRGPIFSGAMVGYAMENLVKASLKEFIPQETLAYVRDIMFHYLANRNLKPESDWGQLKWRATAFDTSHFNARNHFSDEFSDGFFSECQNVICCGYGDTQEERCKSGAAVSALLYTSCLAAMDKADNDNAKEAQNLCSAVGVIANAANSLIMAAPIPGASMISSNLLAPLSNMIKQKIQNQYTKGALRSVVVRNFRDTYVLGALRGERISGMRHRHENEALNMSPTEKAKFVETMKKRRQMGRNYISFCMMYVSALGEEWPSIAAVDEATYSVLTKA